MIYKHGLIWLLLGLLTACGGDSDGGDNTTSAGDTSNNNAIQAMQVDLTSIVIDNQTPYVSPQCYTKTEADNGQVFNPCYTCHAQSQEPNYISDLDLQLNYSFPNAALENPFINLFEDRSVAVSAMSDTDILDYVRTSNYRNDKGELILANRLNNMPAEWDSQGDGKWDGYIPDVYFDFDTDGFDHAPDGSYTGWRAFGYYPFLGTFWPTNGSTDDVLIRLASSFRQNDSGQFDTTVYKLNLAIVEAVILRQDVAIDSVDETTYGVDLNKDGVLSEANRVVFDWEPLNNHFMSYVGAAKNLLAQGKLHLAAGVFPEGTEFAHTVRYIDVTDSGDIALAARMKEFRYARKYQWRDYTFLHEIASLEAWERRFNPDSTKALTGDFEIGLVSQGWRYQGFIEDANGELRPQSQEETFFCMGCHGGISATTDTIFSFPRKFSAADSFQQGWYHWSQKSLAGIPEPRRADGSYEYSRYLEINGAGDEFRANQEVMDKFFDVEGNLIQAELDKLHGDISHLLFPSRERALMLNKAYRLIVQAQDFIYGRDATVTPTENVHRSVQQDQPTGVLEAVRR